MRRSVLIVEDNSVQLEMLKKLVSEVSADARVYTAGDIRTAYQTLIEKTVDVFLVDIILDTARPGDTSGIRLVEKIRTIPKYMFTPVLFVSSLEDATKYTYTDLNCLGYVEKPFAPEAVRKLLEKALHYTTVKDRDAALCFRKDGILYPVRVKEITYIENMNHEVTVNTVNGGALTVPYRPCKELLEEADTDSLIQCSRNVIVNKDHIYNIDIPNRYITLKGVEKALEIGITYKKKIMAEFGV